jgi:hypothetical protein
MTATLAVTCIGAKLMARKGITAFSIHSAKTMAGIGPKCLSEEEFRVVICAASGVSASSRAFKRARVTFAVEWSRKGKKTILHQDCCNPKLR